MNFSFTRTRVAIESITYFFVDTTIPYANYSILARATTRNGSGFGIFSGVTFARSYMGGMVL